MKKMKNIIKSLFAVVLALVMLCGVACGESKEPQYDIRPDPGQQTEFLSLTQSNLNLTVGEIKEIKAAHSIIAGQTLEWESDNEQVATINNGSIEAINVGKANIIATYGNLTATCAINVSFHPTEQPIIVASVENSSTFNLPVGDRYEFSPLISYCGRTFSDGEFTYDIANTDVLEQENGIFVAKSKGLTTVDIIGSWRGLSSNSIRMSVSVKVIDDVIVKLNGINKDSIDVYTTTNRFNDDNFTKVVDITPEIIVNGQQEANPSVVVRLADENGEFATYENGKLTGKAFGQTKLYVEYDNDGEKIVKQYTVNVLRPTATFNKKVNYFSSQTGVLKDETNGYANTTLAQFLYGVATEEEIIDAFIDGQKLTVKDNKIMGITGISNGTYDVVISVGTDTEVYDVEMTVYGQYIYTAEDLNVFNVTEKKSTSSFYAELAKDIYAQGFNLKTHFYDNPQSLLLPTTGKTLDQAQGFTGTFDGKGYSIFNLTVNQYGLFCATHNATIKNVGFINATINNGGLLGDNIDATNIENLYINVGSMQSVKGGSNVIAKNHVRGGYFKNIYVNVPTLSNDDINMLGAFVTVDVNQYTSGTNSTAVLPTFENCVVVSSLPLGTSSASEAWVSLAVAENNTLEDKIAFGDAFFEHSYFKDIKSSGKPIYSLWQEEYNNKYPDNNATGGQIINAKGRILVLEGVKLYTSRAKMIQDPAYNTVFNSFSSDYWSMREGVLVWGKLNLVANEGEIYLDMGDASGRIIQGYDGNPIKANVGADIILPDITCFGLKLVGWRHYVTGEYLQKDTSGKYIIKNYDGKAYDYVAVWEADDDIATGSEIELW